MVADLTRGRICLYIVRWMDKRTFFFFMCTFPLPISHRSQCECKGTICAAQGGNCWHESHASCVLGHFSNQKESVFRCFYIFFFLESSNGKV